jgi:hypothetical protein
MDEIFNFRMPKINIGDLGNVLETSSRYLTPKKNIHLKQNQIKISHAIDLVEKIILSQNERYFCLLSGAFEFGDFIEAFIMRKKLKVKELTISTLSLSKNNINSLAFLLNKNHVEKLNLIVSDFYYSHNKNTAIPYIYKNLDIDDRFDFAVCGTHSKITLLELDNGIKVTMQGSANLRSSANLEQLDIELNNELYCFNYDYLQLIIKNYSLINKSIRTKELWTIIQE